LEQIYSMCTVRLCQFILNGKFFMCPRAAHQDNLNIYRESKDGYVDLMKNSAQDRKKQITELLNKKYINGCNYCNGFATSDRIPAAAQLTAENIKELKEEYGKLKLPKTFYLCAMVGNRILKSIGIRVKRKK